MYLVLPRDAIRLLHLLVWWARVSYTTLIIIHHFKFVDAQGDADLLYDNVDVAVMVLCADSAWSKVVLTKRQSLPRKHRRSGDEVARYQREPVALSV